MEDLGALVKILERGGVVACPTETWLGLLADARNERAVERVAELKGRPADMPIAVLVPDIEAIAEIAMPPSIEATALIRRHWPGPLTILLRAKPGLSPRLSKDGKIGVRAPGPSPAAELTRAFGHALTATSANRTGEPPLRSIDELTPALAGALDAKVPGISPGGAPSTIVDSTTTPMTLVRPGAVQIDPSSL
jgi:L-threonylcarbamoyladenylate synthase